MGGNNNNNNNDFNSIHLENKKIMGDMKEFEEFNKDLNKEVQKYSFKLKYWFKFYSIGIIIAVIILTIVFSIGFFADKIANLERIILIISLISPYIILYIQNLSKRKKIHERYWLIVNKIRLILVYLFMNREIIIKINESSKNVALLKEYSEIDLENIDKIVENLPKFISELRLFDVNELWRLKCLLFDPENTVLHLLDKYIISVKGIISIENRRNELNLKTIREILLELHALI